MTKHEAYNLKLIEAWKKVLAQGRQPKDELREALIDLQINEPEWFAAHKPC